MKHPWVSMRKVCATVVLFAVAALAGCATEPAKPFIVDSARQTLDAPPADKAQIVFLEPINSIQGMFPVAIYDITSDQRNHIATTGAHSRAAVLVNPGKHIFFNNTGHVLEANVDAGKRYYVLLRFIYANGFQLRPIRPTGPSEYSVENPKFATWMAETRFVDKTDASDELFARFADKLDELQRDALKRWQSKTAQERAELTLNAEDAIAR